MHWVRKYICLAIVLIITLNPVLSADALDYRYSMSYICYGSGDYYSQLVSDTQDSLDEVSPDYFTLDDNGSLVVSSNISESFIKNMHEDGVLAIPFLTNGWDREKGASALLNREELSGELASAVSAYDLDGVNIDLENLTSDNSADYVDFIKLLRAKLGSGKTVAVSVAANPYGLTTGWNGSYDYAELARYCDYLMVMTYDESYYGSEPGPVASIGFIEKSIVYALSAVPKDKIVLGIPFYGRIWSSGGGYPNGYGISDSMTEALIEKYNGTVTFDDTTKAACATITVKASDDKPVINGQALPAGTYKIWYSSEQSIKAALDLVAEYDIKGAGSWSLGQEAGGTWDYYTLWLNGCTFGDVQTNWAKNYILSAYMNEWMNGITADSFAPNAYLTRAQAAAVLVRMLGLSPAVNYAFGFDDCLGSWAEAYIDTAREYGIVSGTGGNLFQPDVPVTREQFAVMINNILKYEYTGNISLFTDLPQEGGGWSYDAINALGVQGVLTGYPDGSFRPQNSITRAEAAALLCRAGVYF